LRATKATPTFSDSIDVTHASGGGKVKITGSTGSKIEGWVGVNRIMELEVSSTDVQLKNNHAAGNIKLGVAGHSNAIVVRSDGHVGLLQQPTSSHELSVNGHCLFSGNVEATGPFSITGATSHFTHEGVEFETSSNIMRLTNLPTTEGGALSNGLWRDTNGFLRIKT